MTSFEQFILLAILYRAYNGSEREANSKLSVERVVRSIGCVRVLFDVWIDALVVSRAPPFIALRKIGAILISCRTPRFGV